MLDFYGITWIAFPGAFALIGPLQPRPFGVNHGGASLDTILCGTTTFKVEPQCLIFKCIWYCVKQISKSSLSRVCAVNKWNLSVIVLTQKVSITPKPLHWFCGLKENSFKNHKEVPLSFLQINKRKSLFSKTKDNNKKVILVD